MFRCMASLAYMGTSHISGGVHFQHFPTPTPASKQVGPFDGPCITGGVEGVRVPHHEGNLDDIGR